MKKILEDWLWSSMQENGHGFPFPRDVIEKMVKDGWINNAKQAHRTLEKWLSLGKYDYGCCVDLGWKIDKIFTDKKDDKEWSKNE